MKKSVFLKKDRDLMRGMKQKEESLSKQSIAIGWNDSDFFRSKLRCITLIIRKGEN